MQGGLKSRWASSGRGLTLALAASVGLHAAAAWGAAWWWLQPSWRLEPIHVISVRLLSEADPAGRHPSQGEGRAGPSPRLRTKRQTALERVPPPEGLTPAHLEKTVIVQKPVVEKAQVEPPRPSGDLRVAERLRPQANDPRSSSPRTQGASEGATPAPSTSQAPPIVVARAEPSGGMGRAERLEAIRRRIQEALVYPKAARLFGWEGSARVRIVLTPDGQISNVRLESSSQIGLLDQEVLAAVRRAAPYPYVEGPIVVPVVFDLRPGGP